MTAWMLLPIRAGAVIITRMFMGYDVDHLVGVGELTLNRDGYADLAARFGEPEPFDRQTGDPKRITVVDRGYPCSLCGKAVPGGQVRCDEHGRPDPLPQPVLQPAPWPGREQSLFKPGQVT